MSTENQHPIKIAVIGCGSIGQHHCRILATHKDCKLIALADANFNRAVLSKLPDNLQNIPVYTSIEELLNDHHIHAAVVATPIHTHKNISTLLLKHNVSVLIEKPMATNFDDCKQLLSNFQSSGTYLQIGHIERYNPAFIKLMEEIKNNRLGVLYRMEFRRIGPFPQRISDAGVTLDLSIHDLDLALHIAQSFPNQISAFSEKRIHKSCEDGISITMKFPEEIICHIQTNWLSPRKQRTIEVYGYKGMLCCDLFTQKLTFYENKHQRAQSDSFGMEGIEVGEEKHIPIETVEPLKSELIDFCQHIKNFRQKLPSLESYKPAQQAALAVYLCEQALKSATQQKIIPLEIPA